MSYTQLTQDERYHIQYLSRHCPSPKLPNSLTATKAPSAAKSNGTAPKGSNTAPKKHIRRKLSPEQVCAYLCKHHQITLHHSTIYRYLRQDKSNGGTLWQHLRMRPLQNISLHLFADSQNPNTGFWLFPPPNHS